VHGPCDAHLLGTDALEPERFCQIGVKSIRKLRGTSIRRISNLPVVRLGAFIDSVHRAGIEKSGRAWEFVA